MFRQHPALSIVTIAYLGVVGWITLGPQPITPDQEVLIFRILGVLQQVEWLSWLRYNMVEFIANALMFLPIGLFFLLLFGRRLWWLAMLLGAGLSCAIEFAQLFLPDRVSDPRDLLANSVGAVLGVVIALIVTWPAAVRRSRAARARKAAIAGA